MSIRKNKKEILSLLILFVLLVSSCQRGDQAPSQNQEARAQGKGGGAVGPGGPRGGPPGAETEEERFAVIVTPVVAGEIVDYMKLNGDVQVSSMIHAVSETSGEVVRVFVDVGDAVRKNAALVEIDPSRPGQRFETNVTRAPISGTVVAILSEVGSTVGIGTSAVQISSIDDLELVTRVAERFVSKIAQGLDAEVGLDAYPGNTYLAEVSEVSPLLDTLSRTLEVKLSFKENYPEIKSGMFASIKLITERKQERVKIPSTCIVRRFGQTLVYVATADDTVTERSIVVGVDIDGVAEILDGLLPGELVVYQGQSLLEDGTSIQVVDTVKALDS